MGGRYLESGGLAGGAFETPWKIWNELSRWLVSPRVRLLFRLNGIAWGKGWRFYGVPIVQKHRRSRMRFGSGLQLRSSARSNPLGPNRPVLLCTWRAGAVLEVGDNMSMTGGTICAAERIVIANNVVIGANSIIADTDFHPLGAEGRRLQRNDGAAAPILIEDDVFIGMHCLILKGVVIGQGSVVGAGSVVTESVPTGVLCAGNPARVIRLL
jgi:acetyltransferase-like isoleucine patch superfamily enzyme